jgi:hypothetical protein
MFLLLLFNSMVAHASPVTEVQVNICDSQTEVQQKLGLTAWQKQQAERVYYIDNRELAFFNSGWVLKVSFTDKSKAKIILKNNDADAAENKDCEYDLHGEEKKWACKLAEKKDAGKIQRMVDEKEINALLTDEQRQWLFTYNKNIPASAEITTSFTEQSYTLTVGEQVLNLNFGKNSKGREFNEVSSRTQDDEKTVQSELVAYLKEHNINLCTYQGPVLTRLKLQSYFNP